MANLHKSLWTLLLVLLLVFGMTGPGVCRYRDLYGFHNNSSPMSEVLSKLTFGGLRFWLDGEKSLASEPRDSTPRPGQEYDFIVVGAGSAGATVAARLSEISSATVLLVEAGGNENLLMDVPILANWLQLSNDINWHYQTDPSPDYCRGMHGRRCNWPRGRVMGGSSVLNYMIATRGEAADYDGWAAAGNEGWSYADLLPYFQRMETMGPRVDGTNDIHSTRGSNGPVHIDYPPYHTPLASAFLRAGLELGYPIHDYNERQELGFSYIQATMKNGTRVSTNRAYLFPAANRPNLSVTKNSHVTRVLVKKKRAYGVEFVKRGTKLKAFARKEVILCAGAINSPQLLMLSGIGPKEHLRQHGIRTIQNLEGVGQNLMDHVAYGGLVFLIDQPISLKTLDVANPMAPYIGDFFMRRDGPLTVPGGCEALGFLDVDRPGRLGTSANIELLFIGGSFASDPVIRQTFGISDEHWRLFEPLMNKHTWTIFPMLMHPRSRGEILLSNADAFVKPRIHANYFKDPEDMRVMIAGIKASIKIAKTKAMQQFGSRLYEAPVSGCENYIINSDAYFECAVRTYTLTIYHYSGTCKMAPDTDPMGVVNSRLQVKGIEGLRVADASIMPTIMTGHPNIPIIVIGEKLADMVKEDWGYKT